MFNMGLENDPQYEIREIHVGKRTYIELLARANAPLRNDMQ
jgi:hypothetical protein